MSTTPAPAMPVFSASPTDTGATPSRPASQVGKGEAAFDAFCARFGEAAGTEVMDRITDAECGGSREGITMDVHRHNACNSTLSGTITHAGEDFGFVIDSGDWNGTLIRQWGPAEDVEPYEPEPPILYTFVPADPSLRERSPGLFKVYLAWAKMDWFKDKVRGYNYDRHFAPGVKTERHYRDWAVSKGLKIAEQDSALALAQGAAPAGGEG